MGQLTNDQAVALFAMRQQANVIRRSRSGYGKVSAREWSEIADLLEELAREINSLREENAALKIRAKWVA